MKTYSYLAILILCLVIISYASTSIELPTIAANAAVAATTKPSPSPTATPTLTPTLTPTPTPTVTPTPLPTPTPTLIPYDLSVLVIGVDDAPVLDALVEVVEVEEIQKTDDIGQAFFYDLPGDSANLSIKAQGYYPLDISQELER